MVVIFPGQPTKDSFFSFNVLELWPICNEKVEILLIQQKQKMGQWNKKRFNLTVGWSWNQEGRIG